MEPGKINISLMTGTFSFSNNQRDVENLEQTSQTIKLIPDQLFHPVEPAEFIVRRGKLRVSRFLTDGREITRDVLQAGSTFKIITPGVLEVDHEADIYDLADIVLMSLGEGELWALPPGTLPSDN